MGPPGLLNTWCYGPWMILIEELLSPYSVKMERILFLHWTLQGQRTQSFEHKMLFHTKFFVIDIVFTDSVTKLVGIYMYHRYTSLILISLERLPLLNQRLLQQGKLQPLWTQVLCSFCEYFECSNYVVCGHQFILIFSVELCSILFGIVTMKCSMQKLGVLAQVFVMTLGSRNQP